MVPTNHPPDPFEGLEEWEESAEEFVSAEHINWLFDQLVAGEMSIEDVRNNLQEIQRDPHRQDP